jgi:hypothetical protein
LLFIALIGSVELLSADDLDVLAPAALARRDSFERLTTSFIWNVGNRSPEAQKTPPLIRSHSLHHA